MQVRVFCLSPVSLPRASSFPLSLVPAYHYTASTRTGTETNRKSQVPDGEFLCPKCKTDEAAAPPLTPSKATAHRKGSGSSAAGGPGQSGGEHGRPAAAAARAGSGAAASGAGAGGSAREQRERATGVGVGVEGISMLATDGSMVDLTQIAM